MDSELAPPLQPRTPDPLAVLLERAIARDPAALRRLLDGVAPDVVRVVAIAKD